MKKFVVGGDSASSVTEVPGHVHISDVHPDTELVTEDVPEAPGYDPEVSMNYSSQI
jgi:hypothetical protein